MLQITIPIGPEGWDEVKEEFVKPEEKTLQLEHSLVSLSKWESKWCKAFLTKKKKTDEEVLDYIKCMTITRNVDPDIYDYLTNKNISEIEEYIEAPMTATVVREMNNGKPNREVVTSELIYYWMLTLGIPFECEKWHINRLLTLIKVCNAKNSKPTKRSQGQIIRDYAAINEANKKKFNTKG